MSGGKKRKHVTLTLKDKGEILSKIDSGAKVNQLMEEYGIGRSTIYDITKNRQKIEDFLKTALTGPGKRQTLREGENVEVEEAVYTWFLQERNRRNAPLSAAILQEKARYFYQKITGKSDFRASEGWFCRFKERHGIRLKKISGEKISADEAAIEPFKNMFSEMVATEGLTPDQIYYADESGLIWKGLPD